MGSKEFHEKPFSEETITKLTIFEEYTKKWLPVFLLVGVKELNICDFFAGTGEDKIGIPGSALRILNVIHSFEELIIEKRVKINLYLNESENDENTVLYNSTQNVIQKMGRVSPYLDVYYPNKDFQELYKDIYPKLLQCANLIFLDQCGIKQIPSEVFLSIINLTRTDFMFFISSSFFHRFPDEREKFFAELSYVFPKKYKYADIHAIVLDAYKQMIPANNKTKLYPFTIQKGSNIYGIIFGAKHPLAINKFLDVVWKQNILNGVANFDIHEDAKKEQGVLFDEMKSLTKIEKFEQELEDFILSNGVVTNKEIFDFTLEKGHISSHATNKVNELRKYGKIAFQNTPSISYKKCYKDEIIKQIEVVR